MSAAALLPARMLAASMQTLIGLLASTGLRSGEAGALDAGDLDAAARLLTVTGKYGRIRLVALQSTTVQALTGYLRIRASRAAPAGPLLIGETGHRLNLTMARNIFRSLTRQCRLAPQPGCGAPRLHDFRHRFAVTTLIDAHRQGRDVDACIAVLATHLGHISPVHTYWYLTITPELTDAVSERVALYQKGRRQ